MAQKKRREKEIIRLDIVNLKTASAFVGDLKRNQKLATPSNP